MSAQLAAADLAAADLADDELAAAGALPELPAEPFRGGYTQIGSATAEADRAVAYEERMLDLRLDRDQVLPAAA